MKKILSILLFALFVSAGITNEAKSQTASVSFSIFYNSLKPYGRWMNNSTYGKVWISNTKDFTPYSTGGHWAYTDYGWTWVSDYDWGWAPFHYGRWAYHSTYGWYWIPDYKWAPAWVAWRNNDDYYGWAPLSPGLSISVSVGAYDAIPSGRWVFAPHQYITSPYVSRYYVPRTQNVTIIRRTTVIANVNVRNDVQYVAGPRREDVERVNHTQIRTYTVSNSSRPGKTVINNNTVNVYRPVINNDKTVVNNNKTVEKNSNNTTVNKNSNNKNTTVEKNSNNKTNNKTTTNNNKTTTNNETVNKKPQENKKPANNAADNKQVNNNKQKPEASKNSNISKTEAQKKHDEEVAKRKNQDKNPPPNNKQKN